MKRLISIILALCLAFSLAACGTKAPEVTAVPTPEPSEAPGFDPGRGAEEIAALMADGQYKEVYDRLPPELVSEVKVTDFSNMWAEIRAQLGDFVRLEPELTLTAEYLSLKSGTAFCEFAEGGVGLTALFDADGALNSLIYNYYTPLSAYDFPDYGGATPLMWEVSSPDGGRLYLLGSYHLADESLYALPEKLMAAFEASDALAAEYDLFAASFDVASLLDLRAAMSYPDGSAPADHLTPETYEAAVAFMTDKGVYTEALETSHLAQWSAYINLLACSELGLDSNYGVDVYLLTLAHYSGKKILEIESQEFQLELLASPSDAYFDFAIRSAIASYDEDKEEMSRLFSAYRSGDEAAVNEYLFRDEELDGGMLGDYSAEEAAALIAENDAYNHRMLTERNEGMAEAALSYLESGDTVFYVVGLAHMLGDDGIVQRLKDAGCTVTRFEY